METIKGNIEIDRIKRCYMEDAIVKVKCPDCKKDIKTDLGEQYLSYPVIGQQDSVYLYCEKCDSDWRLPLKVISTIVTIEVEPEKIKRD